MPPQSNSPAISLLASGSDVRIHGGSFTQTNNHYNVAKPEVLEPIYDKVSPNAILNKGGRADTVRCYPGTREEVIERIEKWRRANHNEGHPIFWLSGPAGAGKSAIVQTIAERCIEQKAPMINFFFFRADPSRNDSAPVVATLLYQLINLFPALKERVMGIAANDPVIFRHSMEDQFLTLVEEPLRAIRRISRMNRPVVLIDGLDECSSEHGKTEQTALLRILHDISTKVDPAFIVLVASRNEPHLTMAFNEIGTSPDSIYLDESYRPFDDIRLFVRAEFSRIRGTHSLRDTLDANWPHSSDIDSISHKSSGQFVYAVTVMRFIATSPASPQRSLEIVKGLRPVTKISPFAALDSLYAYILSQAEDWESVRDILAANKLLSKSGTRFKLEIPLPNMASSLVPMGYTTDDIVSNLSELAAIVQFDLKHSHLTVFHASLADFLYNESRAGAFYIDMNAFTCRLALHHFKQATDSDGFYNAFHILSAVTKLNEILDEFLQSYYPPNADTFVRKRGTIFNSLLVEKDQCVDVLSTLYQSQDPRLCKNITNRWKEWFISIDAEEAYFNRQLKAIKAKGKNTPMQTTL